MTHQTAKGDVWVKLAAHAMIAAGLLLGAGGCAADAWKSTVACMTGDTQQATAAATSPNVPHDPFAGHAPPLPETQLVTHLQAAGPQPAAGMHSGPELRERAPASRAPSAASPPPTAGMTADAGPPQPLTLADLEALALSHNPTLARAAAQAATARAGQWQAGQWSNPIIGYMGTEIGNEGRAGQQGLFIEQELPISGKLRLDRVVAQQTTARMEHQFEVQRLRVLNDVRWQYYEVLAAQELAVLADRLVEVAQRGVRAAEGLRKLGDYTDIEVLQARIEADQAILVARNARYRQDAAWRRLASLVGSLEPLTETAGGQCLAFRKLAPDTGFLKPDLAAAGRDWQTVLDHLLETSPEMARSSARVAEARFALERARAEPVPNVTVQGSVQYDAASQDTIAGVQAGLPLPLWHRFQGRIAQAEAELAAAHHDWQATRVGLTRRLAEAFGRYESARQKVATYTRDILPKSQRSLDLVEKAYTAKVGQFTTLLTAQRTFFTTNQEYIEAVKELWQSLVAIDGLVLSESFAGGGE